MPPPPPTVRPVAAAPGRRIGLVSLVTIALARAAAAQPSQPVEPSSAPSLDDRVTAELARRGVDLLRRQLAVRIEPLADRWLVSLVDLTTGRVVAWSKVEPLPLDRNVAVRALAGA